MRRDGDRGREEKERGEEDSGQPSRLSYPRLLPFDLSGAPCPQQDKMPLGSIACKVVCVFWFHRGLFGRRGGWDPSSPMACTAMLERSTHVEIHQAVSPCASAGSRPDQPVTRNDTPLSKYETTQPFSVDVPGRLSGVLGSFPFLLRAARPGACWCSNVLRGGRGTAQDVFDISIRHRAATELRRSARPRHSR